jgi:hypothetical protein
MDIPIDRWIDIQTHRHIGRLQINIYVVYGILFLSIIAKYFNEVKLLWLE